MERTTEDQKRGIQWDMMNHLEDLDFADDIILMSQNLNQLQEKTSDLQLHARKMGLKVSEKKTKTMRICTKKKDKITLDGKPLEDVTQFCYLGSTLTTDGDTMKEIKIRIGKASGAFTNLRNIWKSKQISFNAKLRLYKSNVRSILLYGAESWMMNKQTEQKVRAFEGRCLRRILNIRWPHIISNKELEERTKIVNIVTEIKRRRWNWIGHVLRMKRNRHPSRALHWTPMGKRTRGRPKSTWRRTVTDDLEAAGKTWREITWLAQDREGWFRYIDALCQRRG